MPRIRSIKPSFFQSDDVSALPLRARLTWVGLWTHCDDAGRTKDHARLIKAAIWPLDDVTLADIEDDLSTLHDQGRIVRYEVGGHRYLAIVNWAEHQSINRATPSRIPAPPGRSVNGHAPLSEPSSREGKGGEGKGREGTRASAPETSGPPPPPRTCPKHPDGTDDPCRACKRAREAHELWEADKRDRTRAGAKCPKHRGQLADTCAPCRSEQLEARS